MTNARLKSALFSIAAIAALPAAVLAQTTDQSRFFDEQRALSDGGSSQIIHPQSQVATTATPRMCKFFNQPGLDVVLFTVPCESLQPRLGSRGPVGLDGAEAAGPTVSHDCLTEQMKFTEGYVPSAACTSGASSRR